MAADIAILEDVADATCKRLVSAGKKKMKWEALKIYEASWASVSHGLFHHFSRSMWECVHLGLSQIVKIFTNSSCPYR